MTANPSIDPARFLHDQLAAASPDLLRDLLTTFINALMVRRSTWSAAPRMASPARNG
jgi:hypothetical protein